MRETRRVVAEDERVTNPRPPPLVLIRYSECNALELYHRSRLARVEPADRFRAESCRQIDRVWTDRIPWKHESPSLPILWYRRRIEADRIANQEIVVIRPDQLRREDQPKRPCGEIDSGDQACARADSGPHRSVVNRK